MTFYKHIISNIKSSSIKILKVVVLHIKHWTTLMFSKIKTIKILLLYLYYVLRKMLSEIFGYLKISLFKLTKHVWVLYIEFKISVCCMYTVCLSSGSQSLLHLNPCLQEHVNFVHSINVVFLINIPITIILLKNFILEFSICANITSENIIKRKVPS